MFADVLDNEKERKKLVNQFLSTLTNREEKVLRLYYGIECKKEELKKLCEMFKIKQNSIRRIKNNGVTKIIVVTGKGLHSDNISDPYVSKNLSILKYSVPEFIKKNQELMTRIYDIKEADIKDGGDGAFYIFLKKNNLSI